MSNEGEIVIDYFYNTRDEREQDISDLQAGTKGYEQLQNWDKINNFKGRD